jgi:hypothetical protein
VLLVLQGLCKVQFFTEPILEKAYAKLLKGDNHEISRRGYATIVLFLDERNRIRQANLTYVIPGTTGRKNGASTREELVKYFSEIQVRAKPSATKSKGS